MTSQDIRESIEEVSNSDMPKLTKERLIEILIKFEKEITARGEGR